MIDDKEIRRLESALDSKIRKSVPKSTRALDAVVTRISDGTAYVTIAGSPVETPVSMGIDCKAGDLVNVRVAEGTAYIIGNTTAPPTDDTQAIAALDTATMAGEKAATASTAASEAKSVAVDAKQGADDAAEIAGAASEAAKDAKSVAMSASDTANATASHVWLDTAGQLNVSSDPNTVATGHSMTLGALGLIQRLAGKTLLSLTKTALNFYTYATQSDGTEKQIKAASYTPDGVSLYSDGKPVASFTGSGVNFYDRTGGTDPSNIIANFGNSGIAIGKESAGLLTIDPDSIRIMSKPFGDQRGIATISPVSFDFNSGSEYVGMGAAQIQMLAYVIADEDTETQIATLSGVTYSIPSGSTLLSVELEYVSQNEETGDLDTHAEYLVENIDYTITGTVISISDTFAVPEHTTGSLVLYANCTVLGTTSYMQLGNGIDDAYAPSVMLCKYVNSGDLYIRQRYSDKTEIEWTFTGLGNLKRKIATDSGSGISYSPYKYVSFDDHTHPGAQIWNYKVLTKKYSISSGGHALIHFTEAPHPGFKYVALSRITTQHETAVCITAWNVNQNDIYVYLSAKNNGSVSSSSCTIEVIELKKR